MSFYTNSYTIIDPKGKRSEPKSMGSGSNTIYSSMSTTIGSFPAGTIIEYYAIAKDFTGNETKTQTYKTIIKPSIKIISPNGGEKLVNGSVYRIKWDYSKDIDKVSVGYSFGSGSLNWIVNNIPNTGYYDWTVNIGNTINTQVKIYIIGYRTGVGSVEDYSDNYFNVINANCQKICKNISTRSEGWYNSCTGKLIKWKKRSR